MIAYLPATGIALEERSHRQSAEGSVRVIAGRRTRRDGYAAWWGIRLIAPQLRASKAIHLPGR